MKDSLVIHIMLNIYGRFLEIQRSGFFVEYLLIKINRLRSH